ncbi:hypothetical protein PN36_07335 [Candidatus Thiomargarita nelsonii]|uniref:Uncharacterized protein n=1 Tax=Candidatus Thiomargarita nelsonii TaxID=1003181 RepID=A0A0A6PG01_9GAMM|nr:hypothetical protein PN36_07335 [Candidatus Thiomargarita nelsonii]
MNTLSNFLTICLLLIWSIGVQADSRFVGDESIAKCGGVPKSALVIYVPSKQWLYVPSQDQLLTDAQEISHCFNKVAALTQDNTGKLTNLVSLSGGFNDDAQWQLGDEAVKKMDIYAKSLERLADALNPQQNVNLSPWHVGLSNNLLAWLAELDALVVLTSESYRGLSYIDELSRFTNGQERYSLKINNQIIANDREEVPLTTLFGTSPLSFKVHWHGQNIININTPLEDTEQLSLPLWFLPSSRLKSEITLRLQETKALKAPLQLILIELNTQANELTFKVRDIEIKPTVRYPDAPLTHCPIKKEPAQTWINYLVNGAQLVCPYLDHQNKVKIELIGDGIRIDTHPLLLSLDITLDDVHTTPKDWQIEGAQSNQGVWKILASDLSLDQCSLNFEPISAYAKLAFTSSTVKIPDEICQRLYKRERKLGLKQWQKGQQEKMEQSFEMTATPTPRSLQTHLSKESLWREMHWLLNQKEKCQINDKGYFECESGNNISFLDLLGGQITLQGFNETIHIDDQRLANNQALLAIYCGDWRRLFPLSHRNIIKGAPDNPYAVLDPHTDSLKRYFNPISGYQQLWSLTGAAVKVADIEGFDKEHDRLFTHGFPDSHQQNRPAVCQKYAYYQVATSEDKAESSGCINVLPPKPDTINWVFVSVQGEWRGIWDYRARQLANPLAKFLDSINQEMTFHIWFLDVNDAREIGLEEYSRTTVNSQTDSRNIYNRLIQPIQNMRGESRYANFSQQVPTVLSALAEKQQEGGRYLTILFAHRLSIADLEQQIKSLSLQKREQSLIILSRRLPKQSQRDTWAKQGIEFIRLTASSYWYNDLVKSLSNFMTDN